jgi:hypothetical protein
MGGGNTMHSEGHAMDDRAVSSCLIFSLATFGILTMHRLFLI